MSLITRCPACGTMFKVVADQLKVSQGWVRCGQCAEVFDATAHLLPRELPGSLSVAGLTTNPTADEPTNETTNNTAPLPTPVLQRASGGTEPLSPDALPGSERGQIHPGVRHEDADSDFLADSAFREASLPRPATPPWDRSHGNDDSEDPDAELWRLASELARDKVRHEARGEIRHSSFAAEANAPLTASDAWDSTPGRFRASGSDQGDAGHRDSSLFGVSSLPADSDTDREVGSADLFPPDDVSFVREARRKAFWQRPLVRVVLGGFSLVLIVVLALQVMIQNRDTLAVTHPQLVPLMQALCGPLQCQIRSPRQIESLVIDSSTFNRIATDTYRLSFTLKNTGATVLEMPSLELTLTDSQDQAILRRILGPAEFGVTTPVLAARADVSGVVALKVIRDGVSPTTASSAASSAVSDPAATLGALRVAGYRILAFYP